MENSNLIPYAPPKITSLVSLPVGLIIHIVANSGLKSRALYNTALVNRYFFALALPLIYRDVKFLWTGERLSRSFFRSQEIIEKFLARALLLQSIDISRRYDGAPGDILFRYNNSLMDQLLGRLKFIEELRGFM